MSKSGAMCPSAATSETTDETTGVGEPPHHLQRVDLALTCVASARNTFRFNV
jgi:hypothetical protein